MIVGGGAILTGAYIAGLAVAGGDPSDASGSMAIPVVGPWIALGSRSFRCELDLTLESAERCQDETSRETTLVASYAAIGVAQLLGASLLVIGILDRHESWVRQDLSLRVPSTQVSVEPVFGPTGGGLSLGVRF